MTPVYLNMPGPFAALGKPFGRASVAGLMFFVLGTQGAVARDFPLPSIVGGHRIQSHETELQSLHAPDVTAPEAAELDHLYQQLTQCPGSQCTTRNASGHLSQP
jgi:hypothetical protein